MRRFLLVFGFLVIFVACNTLRAQDNIVKSLETYMPGEGRVTIHQDPKILALIGSKRDLSKSEDNQPVKLSGYRVQVYAGHNSRESRNEAERISARVKDLFPELKIYTNFNPPRWVCRVGDYRTIEEADAMMRRLRKTSVFKEVSIVRDQITIFQ